MEILEGLKSLVENDGALYARIDDSTPGELIVERLDNEDDMELIHAIRELAERMGSKFSESRDNEGFYFLRLTT